MQADVFQFKKVQEQLCGKAGHLNPPEPLLAEVMTATEGLESEAACVLKHSEGERTVWDAYVLTDRALIHASAERPRSDWEVNELERHPVDVTATSSIWPLSQISRVDAAGIDIWRTSNNVWQWRHEWRIAFKDGSTVYLPPNGERLHESESESVDAFGLAVRNRFLGL